MNIIVSLKQVKTADSEIKIDDAAHWVCEEGAEFMINEPDACALEAALRLKEKLGGEVVVVSAGPARAKSAICEALAKGADRGILIEDERFPWTSSFMTAQALASAIKKEKYDLVLAGLQSSDTGSGQTGVNLAEYLNLPYATIIMDIAVNDNLVRVKQELEAGWSRYLELPLPALLTIQSGINTVRYATLMGIKKAKSKPIQHYTPEDLGIDLSSDQTDWQIYTPKKLKRSEILAGTPEETARKLVQKLKLEVHAL